MSIVHIMPASAFNNTYHGTYKDVISRVRFFESRGSPYLKILLHQDDPSAVIDQLASDDASSFLIEYSLFPNVTKALRQRYPQAMIVVRSINLEPLQHFDNHGWWPERGPVWLLYGMGRLFKNDLIAKKYASMIWSISDWENKVYWNRLPGHATIEWLPYFCPAHLRSDVIAPIESRRQVVCMPTSQMNRKSWDLVTRFISFAEQLRMHTGNEYEFLVTGDVQNWGLPESSSVRFTGMIEDLRSFLQTARAVAMLSDKGYGFKTTIGDAIANGAIVFAHPTLAARCPKILQPAIVSVDSKRHADVKHACNSLRHKTTFNHLEMVLRDRSISMLNRFYAQHQAL